MMTIDAILARKIYQVLIDDCDADPSYMQEFINSQTHQCPLTEWKVLGKLGSGGIFYRLQVGCYVTCYARDLTHATQDLINTTNAKITDLLNPDPSVKSQKYIVDIWVKEEQSGIEYTQHILVNIPLEDYNLDEHPFDVKLIAIEHFHDRIDRIDKKGRWILDDGEALGEAKQVRQLPEEHWLILREYLPVHVLAGGEISEIEKVYEEYIQDNS